MNREGIGFSCVKKKKLVLGFSRTAKEKNTQYIIQESNFKHVIIIVKEDHSKEKHDQNGEETTITEDHPVEFRRRRL